MNDQKKKKIKMITTDAIIICLAGVSVGSGYELYNIKYITKIY